MDKLNNRNNHRKCAKCGKTRAEDMSVTYHRFPKPGIINLNENVTKAHAWAKYCWPNKDWSSLDSLKSLHIQNKVLCGRHFHSSQFYDSERQNLNKFAVPESSEVEEINFDQKPTAEGTQLPVTSETLPASPSTALPMPQSSAPYPDTEPPMDVEFLIDEEVPSPLGVQFPSMPSSSNSLLPYTEPPTPATHIQSVDQPEVASPREERPPVDLTLPTQRSTSRRQRSRRMPRWAYDMEIRSIATEERLASAMEAMVELVREIRDDIRSHISGSSRRQT